MIAIGSDHGGYELKQEVMKHLEARGFEFKDYGCYPPKIKRQQEDSSCRR